MFENYGNGPITKCYDVLICWLTSSVKLQFRGYLYLLTKSMFVLLKMLQELQKWDNYYRILTEFFKIPIVGILPWKLVGWIWGIAVNIFKGSKSITTIRMPGKRNRNKKRIFNGGWAVLETLDSLIDWSIINERIFKCF